MIPYGLPRIIEACYPDVADVNKYARKSYFGNGKTYFRSSTGKRNRRRYWKKAERQKVKSKIIAEWK